MPSVTITWSLIQAPGAHVALGVLGAALCLASITDLRSRRIPNLVTFSAAAAGLVLHAVSGGGSMFLSAALAFFLWGAGGILFWSAFRGQGIGAGDVKMAMATAALLGFWPTFWVVFLSNLSQVAYLFVRWIVQRTAIDNFRQLYGWLVSIVAPGTKMVHFKPVGMEDKTPHAPFMLIGVVLMMTLNHFGVLPW